MIPDDILNQHMQIQKESCAASMMDLIGKVHGKIGACEVPFQHLYKDKNIGFTKLGDLEKRGIVFDQPVEFAFDEVWKLCKQENHAGRFPLISLPTESRRDLLCYPTKELLRGERHICTTVLHPKYEHVVLWFIHGGGYGILGPAEIQRNILAVDPGYKVDLATYTLK